ncbi:hypothetical protein HBI49_153190 [Parastagonospora nodorum]|nr:hypothetical protein HBI49_153190 [Parastagonospora nodorum]KAH5452120.1 hypothetical protein HBI30_116360 [Parastagonospora nodorum]KAH5776443.1 hypothetical protein HBI16_082610 [Parastagonospora nodorum]
MSLLEELPHPLAIPGTAPTADEVDVAMRELPGFQEIVDGIEKCASRYETFKKEESDLFMDDTFHDFTDIAACDSPSVHDKRKAIETKLKVVDKQIKILMNNYLKMFYQEYRKHSRDELRMWSFPTIVWQHYQKMFCDVTRQRPDFELDECFDNGNVVPGSKWNGWVKGQVDAFPPSLIIHGKEAKSFSTSQGSECEMHMVNGHGQLVQTIYHVHCGPKLCGTRVDGGPEIVCKHPGHAHQFTKRPREWDPQKGWYSGNPYRYNHRPAHSRYEPELGAFVQLEIWEPYYSNSVYVGQMSQPEDHYDRERYQEFHEFNELPDFRSQEWMDAIPDEADPAVVGTPSVDSSSVESER